MSGDVVKQLQKLSIGDHAENDASPSPPAQIHAVAGLDFALASLRELIGKHVDIGSTSACMPAWVTASCPSNLLGHTKSCACRLATAVW